MDLTVLSKVSAGPHSSCRLSGRILSAFSSFWGPPTFLCTVHLQASRHLMLTSSSPAQHLSSDSPASLFHARDPCNDNGFTQISQEIHPISRSFYLITSAGPLCHVMQCVTGFRNKDVHFFGGNVILPTVGLKCASFLMGILITITRLRLYCNSVFQRTARKTDPQPGQRVFHEDTHTSLLGWRRNI